MQICNIRAWPIATEECTPYSDIEVAVLVEEEKANEEVLAYFRNLVRYVLLLR